MKDQQSNFGTYWRIGTTERLKLLKNNNYWSDRLTERTTITEQSQITDELDHSKNTKKEKLMCDCTQEGGGSGGGDAAGCAVELDATPFCITLAPRPNIP